MSTGNRPLSPHLQVYRPQLTSILSILHRMTGVALAAGSLVLVYWLSAASYGVERFDQAQRILGSPVGLLLLAGWSFAFWYHLCNGIRHLTWDIGWGFELKQVYATGWAVVGASLALTVVTWLVALS